MKAENVPPPLAPMAAFLEELEHPQYGCVYFLVRANRVVYVGQSKKIMGRIPEHMATKVFERVLYVRVPLGELGEVEGTFIRRFKPSYNKQAGPTAAFSSAILMRYGFDLDQEERNHHAALCKVMGRKNIFDAHHEVSNEG